MVVVAVVDTVFIAKVAVSVIVHVQDVVVIVMVDVLLLLVLLLVLVLIEVVDLVNVVVGAAKTADELPCAPPVIPRLHSEPRISTPCCLALPLECISKI